MVTTKQKKKQIVEAFRKDTIVVREYLQNLKTSHAETFSADENQALDSIDRYFVNLETWFAGFASGLKG